MLLSERLRNEWREHARLRPFAPTMALTDEGLLLGVGTALASSCAAAGDSEFALRSAEERIIVLLSVAYGRAIDLGVLGNVRRAVAARRHGEIVIASIHLARAGLPRLDEEAGYRLFAADRLLASGVNPRTPLKACDIDTANVDLLKAGFDPDEPRVPAGNPDGGEWIDGDYPIGNPGSGSSRAPREPSSGAGGSDSTRGRAVLHGYATVYSNTFVGRPTATGELFYQNKMTGAVLPGTIPLRSTVIVTLDSDPSRSVEVYVNDHGLYRIVRNPNGSTSRVPLPGRVIDLSTAAFRALTGMNTGKVMVTVRAKSGPGR